MRKILIVEDDANKLQQVERFLRERFPGVSFESAGSYKDALRMLRASSFSLVVLDMSLPIFEPDEVFGAQTRKFGGRDILQQLKRFHIAVPVIVLTQFETFSRSEEIIHRDDLDVELRADHSDIYKGMVFYRGGVRGWQDQLEKLARPALGDDSVETGLEQ